MQVGRNRLGWDHRAVPTAVVAQFVRLPNSIESVGYCLGKILALFGIVSTLPNSSHIRRLDSSRA